MSCIQINLSLNKDDIVLKPGVLKVFQSRKGFGTFASEFDWVYIYILFWFYGIMLQAFKLYFSATSIVICDP